MLKTSPTRKRGCQETAGNGLPAILAIAQQSPPSYQTWDICPTVLLESDGAPTWSFRIGRDDLRRAVWSQALMRRHTDYVCSSFPSASFLPSMINGNATFSLAVRTCSRLNAWKTKSM